MHYNHPKIKMTTNDILLWHHTSVQRFLVRYIHLGRDCWFLGGHGAGQHTAQEGSQGEPRPPFLEEVPDMEGRPS